MTPREAGPLGVIRHPTPLAIATLPPDAPFPDWAGSGAFSAVIRTTRETVVVCHTEGVPVHVPSHGPYTGYELARHIDPSQPGLLTRLSEAPGRVGISLMPFATFDRGWILVARADARTCEQLWRQADIEVEVLAAEVTPPSHQPEPSHQKETP